MIWEETYRQALLDVGFVAGLANPCCFNHPDRGIAVVVHGDDLTALGKTGDLDWYEEALSKAFQIKVRGRMGENTDCKEMRILNRIVRLTPEGITYEADPRHAEQ